MGLIMRGVNGLAETHYIYPQLGESYIYSLYLYTCGGIHPGRIEPASPRYGDVPWVPSPSVAVFIGFAAQARLVRFVSAGAPALHTLPFGFTPGDATGTQGIRI